MRFGYRYLPHQLAAPDIQRFADVGVAPAKVRATIDQVTTTLSHTLDAVLHATTSMVGCETPTLDRLHHGAYAEAALSVRPA